MWRQRAKAKAIRERETRKLLARPPEPPVQVNKPESTTVERKRAEA